MGKKDKKKGKGAEKTQLKTEKKALSKIKKKLAEKGEDDIEKLISDFQEQDKKLNTIVEEQCSQPSARSGFSFSAHPEKDELIIFGGEYFNGSKTMMFNDLYFYNIKKDQWSMLQCPLKPPPRCSHQAVVLSQSGGQMWVFGGEFASPTRSNFYHYKDFWVYHVSDRRWDQVKAPGGPSSRSGHRMVACRKQLVVFGGFHESIRDYKYFNDVYIFDLETYKWSKVEPVGKGPCPRSSCQMATLVDGRILVYGGYSREKVKKDVDKGITHTDMFYLQLDERTTPPKWKWVQAKPCGTLPSPRSGFSLTTTTNNRAYAFGGVHDEETDEETLESVFHNDLYLIELEKGRFLSISLRERDSERKKRRKVKELSGEDSEANDEDVMKDSLEQIDISDQDNEQVEVKTFEDSVFTVKIGPQSSAEPTTDYTMAGTSNEDDVQRPLFVPRPRMNASLVVKHGILYMYGGLFEEGDRQVTLTDFYSLDVHKLDEWKAIVPFTGETGEWIESEESEDSDGTDDDDDGDEDIDDAMEKEDVEGDGNEDMDTL